MNAPARLSARYPGAAAIKRTVVAARAAGVDVAGFRASPDGSIEVYDARLAQQAPPTLFDEMEKQGKI